MGRPTTMTAAVKPAPGPGFVITTVPVPSPRPDDVLLQVEATSLCGTDLATMAWTGFGSQKVKPPRILGHECCGTVVDVGAAVTGVQVGDLVAVETHIACGACDLCQLDRRHLCRDMDLLGATVDGCFADCLAVPARSVWRLPGETPPVLAALMEPLSAAGHAVFAGEGVSGQRVLITGAGPIGAMALALCRAAGAAHIAITDIGHYRRALAKELGADIVTEPAAAPAAIRQIGQADVLIEASGNPQALRQGLELLRPGGRAALVGLTPETVELDLTHQVILKGITLHGIYGRRIFASWYRTSNLLRQLDLTPLITHVLPLTQLHHAAELARTGACGKVVLLPPTALDANRPAQ